jgi:hypothetical protein
MNTQPDPRPRITALEQAVAALQQQVADLVARMAAVEDQTARDLRVQ